MRLLTASPSGESLVEAKISTRHLPHLQNATSILNLRVNWFPGSGLVNGLLVRINHAKLQWFISSNDVHPNLVSCLAYKGFYESITVNTFF